VEGGVDRHGLFPGTLAKNVDWFLWKTWEETDEDHIEIMDIQVTDGENLNSMRTHSFFCWLSRLSRTSTDYVLLCFYSRNHKSKLETNYQWQGTYNIAYCVFKFVCGETVKFTNKCPYPRQIYRCSCHFSTCARTISVASNVVSEWHLYLYMPAIVGLY
jgi:hypothetical protein